MSAGARFSRTVPPSIGGAVMTRQSVAGRVQGLDHDGLRALVAFGSESRWYDFSQLYDATRLVWFAIALELHAGGARLEYVIPGCVPFRVVDVVDGERPVVVLVGGGKVCVDRRAPRFREVPS